MPVKTWFMRLQRESDNSTGEWAIVHSCDILGKDLFAFCSHHRNLHEDDLESNGLVSLLEEISGKYNIESVA